MKTRIAIYGLERLGRAVYAVLSRRHDVEVVMIATDQSPEAVVDAFTSDAIYASLEETIKPAEGGFHHEERHVHIRPVQTESVWHGHDIDIVIDTLTVEPTTETLLQHQNAGAKRVVFAARSADFPAVILGYNEEELQKAGDAVTAGGAAESAVAPVRTIMTDAFGIEHSVVATMDGTLCCSGVSTCSCGDDCDCDGGCGCCDTLQSSNLPVPTLVASMTELVCVVKHTVTIEAVNAALEQAVAAPYYQGIVMAAKEPVLSDSVIGESVSAVVDIQRTSVDGRLVSVKLWYDREWGYANRLAELTADYGKMKGKK